MGEPTTTHLRNAVIGRYQLLPFYYTAYHTASVVAHPVIRPLWASFPEDAPTFAMDDQFIAGTDILVKPVTQAGASSLQVYLPGGAGQIWYDVMTAAAIPGGGHVTVSHAGLRRAPCWPPRANARAARDLQASGGRWRRRCTRFPFSSVAARLSQRRCASAAAHPRCVASQRAL